MKHAADIVCVNSTVDPSWPHFGRVTPNIGSLGNPKNNATIITITGNNFRSSTFVLIAGVNCTNVEVIDDTTIIATLPSSRDFTSIRAFGPGATRVSIVLMDSTGRTAVGVDVFQLLVDVDGQDIEKFFSDLGVSHAGFVAIIVSSIFICCASCIGWALFAYFRQKSAQSLNYNPLQLDDN